MYFACPEGHVLDTNNAIETKISFNFVNLFYLKIRQVRTAAKVTQKEEV